jgi:hypothetical protein
MITIYPINKFGVWNGQAVEQEDYLPINSAMLAAPPAVNPGQFVVWNGDGWSVLDELPAAWTEAVVVDNSEQFKAEVVRLVQYRLDSFARTRRYDSILSLCTYATSNVAKFAAEGQYGVDARDSTWNTLYAILAAVEAGERPAPTSYDEIEAELPKLSWPDEVAAA